MDTIYLNKLINDTLSEERYNPSLLSDGTSFDKYKEGWREIFNIARHIAKQNTQNTAWQDIDNDIVKSVVDSLIFEHEQYITHCHPQDDLVCGDCSCMQDLRNQQEKYIEDLRNQYKVAYKLSGDKSYSIKRRREFLDICKKITKS